MQNAQGTQKAYYDRRVRQETINVGDWVLLRDMRLATKKFDPRWMGPFKVIRQLSDVNYAIQRSIGIEGDNLPLNSRLPLTAEVVHKNRFNLFSSGTPREEPSSPPQEDNTTQDDPSSESEPHALSNDNIPVATETPQNALESAEQEAPQPRYTLRRNVRPPDRLDL